MARTVKGTYIIFRWSLDETIERFITPVYGIKTTKNDTKTCDE